MFGRIGRFAANHARKILLVTVLLMIGAGALGVTAFGKMRSEGFTDPNAESSRALDLINDEFGGDHDVLFLMTMTDGTVDELANRVSGEQLAKRIAADTRLTDVMSYFTSKAPPLRAEDGRQAITVAKLADGKDDKTVAELRDSYAKDFGSMRVSVGGLRAVNVDVTDQIGSDLALAESIAVPIILALLIVVFGSVVAALLPLAIGAIAVLGTFALLSVLGSNTDVSVFAINLTTALGLGLAIDYALLMVSRFREELTSCGDTKEAVRRTVSTAGRTIMFSALTVAVALSVLLVFPMYFLRSFAYAGIGVVIIAMVSAILVLPALLAVLGPKINKGRLPWVRKTPGSVSALWGRVAGKVMRHPMLAGLPVVLVLLAGALPLTMVEFGMPDDRVLTTASDTRVVGDDLRANFVADDAKVVDVLTTSTVSRDALTEYASRLSYVDGVESVSTSAGTMVRGALDEKLPPDPGLHAKSGIERLSVLTDADPHSARGQRLVDDVRDVSAPSGTTALVGGEAATLVDSKTAIGDKLPLAGGLIAISTFILLFLFTGSVFQPIRALLFNVLGLSATLGLMVMIFQEGWFASLLGFTPMPLDTSMLVLLFCIVFGLSMDYEVFVLSRIKETHDQGARLDHAVTYGLSRTGKLITMAAILLAVSLLAFGTSGVSFIQMFGIGSGIAILVDATLIRGVLVPAGMSLLGGAAWWSPAPLRWLHGKIGLKESAAEPGHREQPSQPDVSQRPQPVGVGQRMAPAQWPPARRPMAGPSPLGPVRERIGEPSEQDWFRPAPQPTHGGWR